MLHKTRPHIMKNRKLERHLQRITSLNRDYILPYTKYRVKDVFTSKKFLNNYLKKINYLCNKYSKVSKSSCSIATSPFTLKLKNKKKNKINKGKKKYLSYYKSSEKPVQTTSR
tara:strand:- start:3010 stop:3348 length:339 start_codon:yes stop_codon:yes gene_type:complete